MERVSVRWLLVVLFLATEVAVAQEVDSIAPPPRAESNVGGAAVGAVLGAGAGFFGVGLLGFGIEQAVTDNCYDFCGLAGFAVGAFVGEVVGAALGAHLGNGRRGSFGAALGVSIGTAGAALVIGAAAESNGLWAIVIAAHLNAVVLTEVGTGRNRVRARAQAFENGRVGIGLAIEF